MNILIYGGKGWIGSQFIELLKKLGLTYHLGTARVDNMVSLQKEIKRYDQHILYLLLAEPMVTLERNIILPLTILSNLENSKRT